MDGPLTKEQLDAETAEWRERCAALGYDPVEVKSATMTLLLALPCPWQA